MNNHSITEHDSNSKILQECKTVLWPVPVLHKNLLPDLEMIILASKKKTNIFSPKEPLTVSCNVVQQMWYRCTLRKLRCYQPAWQQLLSTCLPCTTWRVKPMSLAPCCAQLLLHKRHLLADKASCVAYWTNLLGTKDRELFWVCDYNGVSCRGCEQEDERWKQIWEV